MEWKDIEGYEGYYMVSSSGDIYSCRRDKFLSPCCQGEYLFVLLSVEGVKKHHLISRLVATAFIPNPENKPEVNHKNGKKWDNRKSNLEWNTRGENISHKYKILKYENKGGIERIKVTQFTKDDEFIAEYDSLSDASRITGIDVSQISKCVRKVYKHRTAGGFIWK